MTLCNMLFNLFGMRLHRRYDIYNKDGNKIFSSIKLSVEKGADDLFISLLDENLWTLKEGDEILYMLNSREYIAKERVRQHG